MSYLPRAAVVWRGPSMIDGSPIAVAVTGVGRSIPLVWVFGKGLPHPIAQNVYAGRYEHRAPFPLPGYLLARGLREAVPDSVWRVLEGV